MDHPALFERQPFTGLLAEGPAQQEFEMLGEVGRRSRPPARGRAARPAPRARSTARRPPRPTRAVPGQATPPERRPGRRPGAWPGWGSGYALPVLEPFGPAIANPDTWRCMQACLGRAPAGDAPPPAAEPAPADAPADASADGGANAGGDAAPDAAEEFEFAPIVGAIGKAVDGIGQTIGQLIDRAGQVLGHCKIVDLTAQSDKSVRKGTRDPKSVYALVLHQMACCYRRKDPMRSYLRIKSHFAILPEGQILQLHPVGALIWASNGFNAKSVAVEFAGNFPSDRGRWWKGETYGKNRVTPAQLAAGRCLVRHLQRTMGLRVVLAHRQSSGTRGNDPGPDVWYHVGQWAVDALGLSDGGAGFKVGSGAAIPDTWRTWGRAGAKPTPELEVAFEQDENEDEDEDELWRGAPEGETESEEEVAPGLLTLPQAIHRARGPGVYTLFKEGKRVYVGESDNVRRRLQEHMLCLTHLSLSVARFRAKLTPMPHAPLAERRRVQRETIARYGLASQGGQLANRKASELEFSFEPLGKR